MAVGGGGCTDYCCLGYYGMCKVMNPKLSLFRPSFWVAFLKAQYPNGSACKRILVANSSKNGTIRSVWLRIERIVKRARAKNKQCNHDKLAKMVNFVTIECLQHVELEAKNVALWSWMLYQVRATWQFWSPIQNKSSSQSLFQMNVIFYFFPIWSIHSEFFFVNLKVKVG